MGVTMGDKPTDGQLLEMWIGETAASLHPNWLQQNDGETYLAWRCFLTDLIKKHSVYPHGGNSSRICRQLVDDYGEDADHIKAVFTLLFL